MIKLHCKLLLALYRIRERYVDQEDQLSILQDETKTAVERLRAAVHLELEYWDNPSKSPPNLSLAEFLRLVKFIPLNAEVRWKQRTSTKGQHGRTGEDQVFNINFEIVRGRHSYLYYLKGYFFDQGDLKGVSIQSFRLEAKRTRQKFRIV